MRYPEVSGRGWERGFRITYLINTVLLVEPLPRSWQITPKYQGKTRAKRPSDHNSHDSPVGVCEPAR